MSGLDITAELTDPATSPERLAAIAYAHPEHCAGVAAHPNCYDGLRDWIAQYYGAEFSTDAEAHTDTARSDADAPDALVTPVAPADAGVRTEAAAAAVSAVPAKPKSGPRKRLIAVGAVIAPLITVAAVVIPLAASSNETESAHGTLRLRDIGASRSLALLDDAEVIGELDSTSRHNARHADAFRTDWKVPVDAPFESFPTDFEIADGTGWAQCGEDQLTWLEEHAVGFDIFNAPERGEFSMTLHNDASSGGALALSDIRFVGAEEPTTAWVYMACSASQRGATGGGQPFLIDVTGDEAVYGESVSSHGDVEPEGSPVTINLAPGEAAGITLTRAEHVDRQREYRGSFVATLADNDEIVVLAHDVVFPQERVDGYGLRLSFSGDGFDAVGDTGDLLCSRPSVPHQYDEYDHLLTETAVCTPREAQQLLRDAAQATQ